MQLEKLRFDFNALATFEEIQGSSLLMILNSGNIGFLVLRNLIYVGLMSAYKHSEEPLNPTRVGLMLQEEWFSQGRTIDELMLIVFKTVRNSGLITDKADVKKPESQSNPPSNS